MRKSNLKQYKTINGGAMTGTSVITSAVTDITVLDNISYQFDFTGTPTGTFQIQVSGNHNQDEIGNSLVAGTWIPLPVTYWNGSAFVTSTTVPTSVGSPIFIEVKQTAAPYIRCVYTNASSTGTLTATVSGKMI